MIALTRIDYGHLNPPHEKEDDGDVTQKDADIHKICGLF
jgi:hypothetical protein